jgi:hypothetical protein
VWHIPTNDLIPGPEIMNTVNYGWSITQAFTNQDAESRSAIDFLHIWLGNLLEQGCWLRSAPVAQAFKRVTQQSQ